MPKSSSKYGESRARRSHGAKHVARGFMWAVGAVLVALVIVAIYRLIILPKQAVEENSATLERLQAVMPNSYPARETNTTRLVSAEIDGVSYVGVLTISYLDVTLPVRASWDGRGNSPGVFAGNPTTNDFVIGGPNVQGVFSGIASVPDGQAVTFTDMYGRVYRYSVVTAEVLDASDTAALTDDEADQWDLTLYCPSPSGLKLEVLRLVSVMEE